MKLGVVFVHVCDILLFSLLNKGLLVKPTEARGSSNTDSEFVLNKNKVGPSATIYKELGGVVKLRCAVETPDSEVKWYKNGKHILLKNFPKFHIKKKKSRNRTLSYEILVFTAEQDSSGKYKCTVKAKVNSWEQHQNWEVKIETKKVPRAILHKNIGAAIRLECRVEPWLRVKWKKSGKRLRFKSHPHVQKIRTIVQPWSNSSSSILFNAGLKDSGEYECLVSIKGAWKKKKKWSLRINAIKTLVATQEFVNESFGWIITASWIRHHKSDDDLDAVKAFVVHWQQHSELGNSTDRIRVNGTKNAARIHVLPNTKCSKLSLTVYGEVNGGGRTCEAKTDLKHVGDCTLFSSARQRKHSPFVILVSLMMNVVLYHLNLVLFKS